MIKDNSWRGLTATVLRPADGSDCTLNGVSSTATRVTVVGVVDERGRITGKRVVAPLPTGSQVFNASSDAPAVALSIRNIGGPCLSFLPVEWNEDSQSFQVLSWSVFGGNFAYVGDSRFNKMVDDLTGHRFYGAIALHDRFEDPDLSRVLSS